MSADLQERGTCSTCDDFRQRDMIYEIPVTTIDSTASSGCPYCSVIQQCLYGMFNIEDIRRVTILNYTKKLGIPSLFSVLLYDDYAPIDGGEPGVAGTTATCCGEAQQEGAEQWMSTPWAVPEDPGSDQSYNFISQCLQRCLDDHSDICGSSKLHLQYPSRVIRVGNSTDDLIRVVRYHPSLGPYLALSHCWGGKVQSRLTSSDVSMIQGVMFHTLPSTFRDAIKVTMRLGYTYLWIDSLCIQQDSTQDWEKESKKMGDIYWNAEVTIAAASSEDSNVSFLQRRSNKKSAPINVIFVSPTGRSYNLHASREFDYHDDFQGDGLGPIHQRAWCFQEHVLSRRLLSYNSVEITFRCRAHVICQCHPWPSSLNDVLQKLYDPSALSDPDFFRDWLDLIGIYSGKKLTFPKDKLIALSAVARLAYQATGWTYIAGVWKEFLVASLGWQRSLRGPDRGLTYVAPSFSWASIIGETFYDTGTSSGVGRSEVVHTKVVNLDYTLATRNRFDRVLEGAFIELEGPLLEASVLVDQDGSGVYASHDDLKWLWTPDSALKAVVMGSELVPARSESAGLVETIDGLQIAMLFLSTEFDGSGNPDDSSVLVLRRLRTNTEVFERIGIMRNLLRAQMQEDHSRWMRDAKMTRVKIY